MFSEPSIHTRLPRRINMKYSTTTFLRFVASDNWESSQEITQRKAMTQLVDVAVVIVVWHHVKFSAVLETQSSKHEIKFPAVWDCFFSPHFHCHLRLLFSFLVIFILYFSLQHSSEWSDMIQSAKKSNAQGREGRKFALSDERVLTV
jgi:hypothetical protein